MTDLPSFSDDEMISFIGQVRGDDRELLIEALGFTRGDTGVPFLRSQLGERGRGSAHLRVAVLGALVRRLGPEATPDLVSNLTGGNLHTQTAAVADLQDVDEGQAAGDVIAWLRRRLRAAKRENTWGDFEVSGVLRYAIRVGALPQLLELLEAERERLQPVEREQLERVWPAEARARFRDTHDSADGPDALAVDSWYHRSAFEFTDEQELQSLGAYVRPVIARLQKRRADADHRDQGR